GVPFEMRFMMNKVIDIIKQHFDSKTIEHRTLLLSGIGESFLSDMLEDFEANLPSNISLAYLPKGGTLRLRLTVKGKDKQAVIDYADSYCADLRKRVDEYFMGFDSDNIAQTLGKRLIERKETITTAESCTGGNIAHLITLVAGSSRYYKGSVVSYANEVKENLLGVQKKSLEEFGAVSEEVVRQMAEGARKLMKTDYAIATSGIAGPDGGSDEKPIGTVWIAVSEKEKCVAKKFLFNTTRENFIERTSNQAILMCLEVLASKYQD
ncbi:MAG: nicotinamide-nucleotide amidohydrolase family protein, partial [Bacteroidales bacterium]|nr:nicotinamide-nucleotide amidohydrolase family protein [Bacteroidales bacterium]